MTACQKCGKEIPEINEGQFCPFCGNTLSEEEGLFEYEVSPESDKQNDTTSLSQPQPALDDQEQPKERQQEFTSGQTDPDFFVHWENRKRFGFLHAFGQTWSESIFRSTQFFNLAPRAGNLGSAFLFAFIIFMIAGLVPLIWQDQLLEPLLQLGPFEEVFGNRFSNSDIRGFYALTLPFSTVIYLFTASAILHVSLLIVGSGRSGWEATFRAICYSTGPQLFALIPFCGGLIAMIWQLIIMVIGCREFHQSTTGRVVLAVFLPLILCCGLFGLVLFQFMGNLSNLESYI